MKHLLKALSTGSEVAQTVHQNGLKLKTIAAILLQTVSVVATLATPALMGNSFSQLMDGARDNHGDVNGINLETSVIYSLVICAGVLLSAVVFSSLAKLIANSVKYDYGVGVGSKVLRKFTELDLDYILSVDPGIFIQEIIQVQETQEAVSVWLDESYPVLLEYGVSDIFAFAINWRLGTNLIGLQLVSVLVALYGTNSTPEKYKALKMNELSVYGNLIGRIQDHEVIRLFGQVQNQLNKGVDELKQLSTSAADLAKLPEYNALAQNILGTLGAASLVGVSAYELMNNRLPFHYFVMMFFYALQYSQLLGKFSRSFSRLLINSFGMEATQLFLGTTSQVLQVDNPIKMDLADSTASIRFENVTFKYDNDEDNDKPILDDVSFNIRAGSKTAIVGLSGAGKSTISKLLLQFYQPASGRILINDMDASALDFNELRTVVGVVSQRPKFSEGTLADVIRYAMPNNEITDDEIIAILRKVELSKYATKEALEKNVGQGGLKLSGGEMQRLAIARVLIREPFIYILDEAMSALDPETAANIQDMLDKTTSNRTTIVITHHLLSIINADEIIVLDNGKVEQQGSFERLKAEKNGRFYQLLRAYCASNSLDIDNIICRPREMLNANRPENRRFDNRSHFFNQHAASLSSLVEPSANVAGGGAASRVTETRYSASEKQDNWNDDNESMGSNYHPFEGKK